MATIATGDASTMITVATMTNSGATTIANGVISVTVVEQAGVYSLGTDSVGTVTVTDIPYITLDYRGENSGNKLCPAAKSDDKAGICEGDGIIFTISADAAPPNDLVVRYGQLAAGVTPNLDYGFDRLTPPIVPYNYIDPSADSASPNMKTIPGGQRSVSFTIATVNRQGASNEGSFYVEIIDGQSGNRYRFVHTGKGNGRGNNTPIDPRTSNCDAFAASGRDGDDDSECFVRIHSVAPAVVLPIVSIEADVASVEEGVNATFTITTNTAPGAGETLEVFVDTAEVGSFISSTAPASVTISGTDLTAVLTVATDDDGNDESDGSITAEIATDAAYTIASGNSTATVAVTDNDDAPPPADLPTVSIDFVGLTSGTDTCEAAATTRAANEGGKDGVCEGDAIVYIITSDTEASADLDVRLGRLAAGRNSNAPYGLTDPHNYIGGTHEAGGHTVTIPMGQTEIRYTVPTTNNYGNNNIGAMYVEIICVSGETCVADGTGDYTFSRADRGQTNAPAAAGNTSTCSPNRQAMSDGNENSECLVDIHPVAPPIMSVAAAAGSVVETNDATFNITASKAPNHYNAARDALIALPIDFAVTQTGGPIATDPIPDTADLPVNGGTITVTLMTKAGDYTTPGTMTLTLADGTGYTVAAAPANAAAISVTEPAANPSTTPTADLAATSDTQPSASKFSGAGSNSDDITSEDEPTITVTGVVDTGVVLVTATHATAPAVTMSGTASTTTIDITLPELTADGLWNIVARHTEPGKDFVDSAVLPITIDTTAPTIVVAAPNTNPAMSKVVSATTTDDGDSAPVMKSRNQGDGGSCPANPGSTANYTAGADLTYTDENENGTRVCFYSTDVAGNIARTDDTMAPVLAGIDTTPPGVTLAVADASIATEATTTLTITLTEAAATDLVAANITVSGGGTLGALAKTSGSEIEYTGTFTAGANAATATFTVAAGAFTDAAGNGNTAATAVEVAITAAGQTPTSGTPRVSFSSTTPTSLTEGDDLDIVLDLSPAAASNNSIEVEVS
ncbi:MAG: Ig-like domain-containing protein, partial [Pseudohongiellaceae bacterium]